VGPRPQGVSQIYLYLKTRWREQRVGDAAASAYCAVRETGMERHHCLPLPGSSAVVLEFISSVEKI